MSRRAVFLDKDGTLVNNVPYNVNPDLIELAPGALEGARMLHDAGYALVIITNQAGVARGMFPEAALGPVDERLRELLGVPVEGFYYCPHHPEGTAPQYAVECDCRKPQPGLLRRAARDLNLDLDRSWMVGDILNDVEAGHRAGCRSILVLSGGETEWDPGPKRSPDYSATDMLQVAQIILRADRKEVYRAHHAAAHH